VTGIAVVILMAGMAGGWLFRRLLLRTLRDRHPREFAELGQPSDKQLDSILPKYREQQIRFWKYLWEGRAFRLNDRLLSGLAVAALVSDVALAAGLLMILWSAGK
jgi:hypothetical protein